jgi:hypothetical protein
MNHFVVDFFLRSTLLRKFLHPSEIGNFHGNVIGIQQNCQLRGGNFTWRQFIPLSRCAFTARQLLS